jgi:glutamyl-tRNA reductase
MDDMVVLHRKSSQRGKPFGPKALVWKTCLRQIAFATSFEAELLRKEGDEAFEGATAYAFLLEVICGLRSPVIGETEVFGQFKNFVSNSADFSLGSPAQDLALKNYFQTLIQAAKSLRAQHLVGLGSQGYGSLVRKLSKADESIAIFGSGQLAAEVLPWVAKEKTTQLICRNKARGEKLQAAHPSLQVIETADQSVAVHPCLVVAAPVSDRFLLAWLKARPGQVRKILDLRGELEDATAFGEYQFISLKDVFANIEKNRAELEQKVLHLKQIVQERAQEHCERIHYRPFGWEDLCV